MNSFSLETLIAERVQDAQDFRVADRSSQRLLGSFYTSDRVSSAIARWCIRSGDETILEPSFGDGAFLSAVKQVAASELRSHSIELHGVELVREEFEKAIANQLIERRLAHLGDFLSIKPFAVDCVVGNPPYVRTRHLPKAQQLAVERAWHFSDFGKNDASGSIWLAFILHATKFLNKGGRLGFVLPFEVTYVRYGRRLWNWLGERFGKVKLVRVRERMFPNISQEAVILLADQFGETTSTVDFAALDRLSEIDDLHLPAGSTTLSISELDNGTRAFQLALLPNYTRELLREINNDLTEDLHERATFNIGYVAGDKQFFHPTQATASSFRLKEKSLVPTITSGRQLAGIGIRTTSPDCLPTQLFYPTASRQLTAAEINYIGFGEDKGIHLRYKCAAREPWYRVPLASSPDLLLSVFSDRPLLIINDAGYVASNSLLCGYLVNETPESFLSSWYNSLTLLSCELEIHSLGGGVMIFVPNEVRKVKIVRRVSQRASMHFVNQFLRAGLVEDAYCAGDRSVLEQVCGLSSGIIDDLRQGVLTMRRWRTGK